MPPNEILTVDFWRSLLWNALDKLMSGGVKILVILLLYGIARKIAYRLIDAALARIEARQSHLAHTEERVNRLRTLQGLLKSVVGYALFFVLIIMLLDALGANVSGIITTAGVGGLAIGFGAQKLVRDVISGFFIIMEDQYGVGDYVTIGAATGIVEEIGMRITRLRDDQGRLWVLANGDISTITNHSRAPVEAFIEIGIAASADVQQAEAVLNAAGETLFREEGHRLHAPPRVLGVSAFDAAKTTLRVAVVCEPRVLNAEQMRVREAIRQHLVQEGIAMA
jgi:small conductance mechanosensitive channel